MKIIFATHNQGKVKEIRDILKDTEIEIVSAEEAGIVEEPDEDGQTCQENALKKAKFVVEKTGEWAMADDTGIFIGALNGQPGIYASRWAGGRNADFANFTLDKMADVPEERRDAYFFCAAVICSPDGRCFIFEGKVIGKISLVPLGMPRPTLPYDVIFIPQGHERTFAQMNDEEKHLLSHRGIAFKKLSEFIKNGFK